jgi:thiamine biosynthesis protein ThiC
VWGHPAVRPNVVSDPSAHLAELVDVARRKLANREQRSRLDQERNRLEWRIVHKAGLKPRQAAEAIHAALVAAGLTPDEIAHVGVSEASIRPIARLTREP